MSTLSSGSSASRHTGFQDLTDEQFLHRAAHHIEVLNHALRNIPAEALRMHICWGNYEGPHDHDIPLEQILPIVLRAKPLAARRNLMEAAIRGSKVLFASHRLNSSGLRAFQEAKTKGYEGVVAKDLESPYIEGRTRRWLKFKVHREDEFVVAGYTQPAGSRKHFGALLLGAYHRGNLQYVGKVGTGFDRMLLASLFRRFQPLVRRQSALIDPPQEKDVTNLAPRLVAQISYQELTADQKLRQPVFLGLRDDKDASRVFLPGEEK